MTWRTKTYIAALTFPVWVIGTLALTWFAGSPKDPDWIGFAFFFLIFFWVGRWDLTSVHLRVLPVFAFLLVALLRWGWIPPAAAVVLLTAIWAYVSRAPAKKECLALKFPLRGGSFYVAHGGSTALTNHHHHHHRNASQKYALDITKVNAFGERARGILPRELAAYEILGTPVNSPCDGVATTVVDGLPDLPPGEMDEKHIAGNHVVIRYGEEDIYIGLAHLKKGSIKVRPGDKISVGEHIAHVGNSGRTSEPHLHIHAKRGGSSSNMLDGVGVPMRFDGKWLARNFVVRAK
jgi:murein DD-endopeptidase MepM/ murein hydrolase activator NlpD